MTKGNRGSDQGEHRSGALLKIGHMCTSSCVFCHAGGPQQNLVLPLREVCRRVLSAQKAGFNCVVLSGGEPTAHPDFLKIVKFIHRRGLPFGLITNGIALSREGYVDSLVLAGLSYVNVSLHGPNKETHDQLVGVPSFSDAIEAIAHLALIQDLTCSVTTVVAAPNLDAIAPTVELVSSLLAASAPTSREGPYHRLTLVEPKGRASEEPSLLPDPAQAAHIMEVCLSFGDNIDGGAVIRGVDGLPLCLLPEHESNPQDLVCHGMIAMQEVHENRLFPVDGGRRAYADGCRECSRRPDCQGIYEGYLPRYYRSLKPYGDHHEP